MPNQVTFWCWHWRHLFRTIFHWKKGLKFDFPRIYSNLLCEEHDIWAFDYDSQVYILIIFFVVGSLWSHMLGVETLISSPQSKEPINLKFHLVLLSKYWWGFYIYALFSLFFFILFGFFLNELFFGRCMLKEGFFFNIWHILMIINWDTIFSVYRMLFYLLWFFFYFLCSIVVF